jgi:pimeloyl-ACP methyl ester carboxylesterase
MPEAIVNGIRLHYQVTGEGTPIVFLHPPLLTGETFNYQKYQLSDEFQIITYDMRGHGSSEYSRTPLTYPLLVEDLKQLLDLLGIKQAYLCGYSTGGQLALAAMLTWPERFLGGILISGAPGITDWYNRFRLSLAEAISRLSLKRLLCSAISFGNADAVQTFMQLYGHACKGHIRNLGQYYACSKDYSCTSLLQQIKAPVLLIFGGKDRSFHRYAHLLHRQLNDSTLYMIRNSKHQIPLKAAKEMNLLVRNWVKEQEQRRAFEQETSISSEQGPTNYDILHTGDTESVIQSEDNI